MPVKTRIPSYRLHKPKGLAVVRLNGRDIYLGKHGSPESHTEYKRVIAEWLAASKAPLPAAAGPADTQPTYCSVAELLLAYRHLSLAAFTRSSLTVTASLHACGLRTPHATQVAGFNTWKRLGRHVKKGEKGIVIIAPMSIRPKDDDSTIEQPDKPQRPIFRFKAVYVFDIAQTEGKPLPEHAAVSGDPSHHLDRLKAHVAEMGIGLSYENPPAGTYGASHGGRITIQQGLPAAEEFTVLAHELAHELLHRDNDRPASKIVRETEAEAVAFVVCQAAGLETSTAASDYIQLYQGDTETLAASLERIQHAAAGIILGTAAGSDWCRLLEESA